MRRFALAICALLVALSCTACGAGVMETKATNTAAGDVTSTIRTPSLFWPRPLAPRRVHSDGSACDSCDDGTCPATGR